MLLVLIQGMEVLVQRVEPCGLLGGEPRGAVMRDIGHDAADPQQTVAELRSEIAAAPDPAQNDAKIGLGASRKAIGAGLGGTGPEQPMRYGVELAGDAFKQVGDAIDNRFQ